MSNFVTEWNKASISILNDIAKDIKLFRIIYIDYDTDNLCGFSCTQYDLWINAFLIIAYASIFALWISQEEEDDYDEDESGASSECESDNGSSKSNGETVSSPSNQTNKPNYTNSSQTNQASTGWPRTG